MDNIFFQRFRDKVSHALGGKFGMPFYTTIVLQHCHDSPTIWHLAIAVAAIATSVTRPKGDEARGSHEQFALLHVNTALRSLRSTLQQSAEHLRLAVTACSLLCAFETIQGNYRQSRAQLTGGRSLFNEWRAMVGTKVDGTIVTPTIEYEFYDLFMRLEFNFSIFAAYNPVDNELMFGDKDPIIMEDFDFTTPFGVRLPAYKLYSAMFRFIRKSNHCKVDRWPPHLPASLHKEGTLILHMTDYVTEGIKQALKGHERESAYLIYANGLKLCRIAVTACLATDEYVYDRFLDDFQEILDDSKVVQEAEKLNDHFQCPSLMDVELIIPLFLVGSRCRNGVLRREVLAILRKYPRRQSL